MENVSVLSPTTFPRNHSGLACIVSLGQQHLSSCLSLALLFFASDKGTAGKCRRSASSMYRGMLAWSAHVKKIAGYGAAATVGGATRTAAAGSGMGVFGFTSAGILKGSTAAKMMASAGGMLKAGSWCSFWQSASTASYSSLSAASVFGPCTLGMAAVGVFAYSKRREMYQGMTSVYTKNLG